MKEKCEVEGVYFVEQREEQKSQGREEDEEA